MTRTEQIEAEIEDGVRDAYGVRYGGFEGDLDGWLEDTSDLPEYRKELHKSLACFYSWGTNYDAGTNPFNLFRDLVGWSEEVVGGRLYSERDYNIGHLEADYLADALKLWATYPYEVELWLNTLDGLENE